jgi:hypothetical protein
MTFPAERQAGQDRSGSDRPRSRRDPCLLATTETGAEAQASGTAGPARESRLRHHERERHARQPGRQQPAEIRRRNYPAGLQRGQHEEHQGKNHQQAGPGQRSHAAQLPRAARPNRAASSSASACTRIPSRTPATWPVRRPPPAVLRAALRTAAGRHVLGADGGLLRAQQRH